MEECKVNISAPNLVSICIDKIYSGDGIGRLYHRFSEEPVLFHDLNHVLIVMEGLYDWLGYPQAATESRSFRPDIGGKARRGEGIKMLDQDKITGKSGDKATFVVHVKYRQNATWQGSVVWAEEKKTCNFRSALELLKLIDGALDHVIEPDEQRENLTKDIEQADRRGGEEGERL